MKVKLSIRQQAVRRAADIAGEPRRLARRLRVPLDDLLGWANGREQPPNAVFLACVDIILDNEDSIDGELLRDAEEARDGEEPQPKKGS
ncbi:MAG TPA: hypothetical protein VG873_02770 [Burkholderiales bacterium]|jgi:hypothetical protein|nr:hypothetical protein [Burkholderiales bacterium]